MVALTAEQCNQRINGFVRQKLRHKLAGCGTRFENGVLVFSLDVPIKQVWDLWIHPDWIEIYYDIGDVIIWGIPSGKLTSLTIGNGPVEMT